MGKPEKDKLGLHPQMIKWWIIREIRVPSRISSPTFLKRHMAVANRPSIVVFNPTISMIAT